jgi:membrane protease YdiL (CAAX protease family)
MASTAITREDTRPSATQSALAWVVTLALLSRLPEIIAREVLHANVAWINWLWVGSAALFFALSYVWPAAQPLRRYFLIMLIILGLIGLIDPWLRSSSLWTTWFGSAQSPVLTLLAERVLLVLEAFVVVGALAAMRFQRKEYYLTLGDLNAPVGGLRVPWVSRWGVLGPILAVVLTIFYVAIATTFVTPTADLFVRSLPLLPLALLAALLNSFSEEMLYRAAPFAGLVPVIGSGQSLWLMALWFGLGHYYGGIPSGIMGLVFAGALGLLFGKAMLDTRGIAWPWLLHFLTDAVIFAFFTMAAVAPK